MPERGIVVVGLGPAGAELITREAWDWLNGQSQIWVRNKLHPALSGLPEKLQIHSFDLDDGETNQYGEVLDDLVDQLLKLVEQGVTYAVPGSPRIADLSVSRLMEETVRHQMPLKILDGMSFTGVFAHAIGQPIDSDCCLVDCNSLLDLEVPGFPPTKSAILYNLTSREQATEIKLTLMAVYPDEHLVTLVHAAGSNAEIVEPVALWEIDRSPNIGGLTSLYVPAREAGRSLEDFQQIIARLRAPNGCPWDREQTHLSLRSTLLEESYEVLQALDEQDTEHLKEELGDLLLQIVLHAQIASEDLEFNMSDVLLGISQKLIRRHPHVFGELNLETANEVIINWEKIKAGERKARGEEKVKGMLDGIPLSLPALNQADQIQKRAKRVGFDWQEITPVIAKIHEEMAEFEEAETEADKMAEAGDLLFATVNLIRWFGIDPEVALRECNLRFKRRFGFIEKQAANQGRTLQELSFEEMDALWEDAKVALMKEAGEGHA